VVIAGGYGTGRELVEYFLQYGTLGGILGMLLITTVMWALMQAVTFEFSRVFKAYDYRTFFKSLIGKFWFIFEILYFIALLLVLAVVGSASGALLRDNFGIPYLAGVLLMLGAIGFLTFAGSGMIEKFFSGWAVMLYLVYVAFLIISIVKFGPQIQANLASASIKPGWALGGFKYALYSMTVVPAVLFSIRHIETRKEAVLSGIISGVIGIFPAFLFLIAITAFYPEILSEEIPAVFAIHKMVSFAFLIIYQVVLLGTLIQTGTGFIHAVNERIQSSLQARDKELPRWMRPVIAVVLLSIGFSLATFGIIALIAKGYGSLSWGVFIVYFIPLMTVGVYKIVKKAQNSQGKAFQ
jgi:uncharacterized membrane protein YkvI